MTQGFTACVDNSWVPTPKPQEGVWGLFIYLRLKQQRLQAQLLNLESLHSSAAMRKMTNIKLSKAKEIEEWKGQKYTDEMLNNEYARPGRLYLIL